jgi:hypothetical protein
MAVTLASLWYCQQHCLCARSVNGGLVLCMVTSTQFKKQPLQP